MRDRAARVLRRVQGLPSAWLALLVVLGAAAVGAAGYLAYRTYDYVEHDNQFCLSCHLMQEPYEQFARSAHRDLGCKACHKPTFAARSQMALTQIVEQPDTLTAHAEVTNDRCAACHVRGDPDDWRLIASSAGHRIHLESGDPVLQGLQCVECHSTSLHEFAAADRTCLQADCHPDAEIELGAMASLTIHCMACHDFSTPVPRSRAARGRDSLLALALRPEREECLSCHSMRERLRDFPTPAEDPHDAACGACHDVHAQETPGQAMERCTDCHAGADTLTAFHRGLPPGTLQDCGSCHEAHRFSEEGSDCLACHAEKAGGARWSAATTWTSQDLGTVFRHEEHGGVPCTACHATSGSHGRTTVTGIQDCRSCHHTVRASAPCVSCHRPAEYRDERRRVTRTLRLSVGTRPGRSLPFDHVRHESVACESCHTGSLSLDASEVDCASCHEEHHRPATSCRSCHERAPAEAHPRRVHTTCSGAGCHEEAPVSAADRTRSLCLGCHQDLDDHRPGRNCAECHQLPPIRAGGGDR